MNPEEALAAFGPSPNRPDEHTEFVSTGSLGLDLALGTGGWPVGKISVIYGPAFTAKTTLALSSAREMQRLGIRSPKYSPTVAYVNYDQDFNPDYASAVGVDVGRLLVFSEMPSIELVCPIDFMVVDSISSPHEAWLARDFTHRHDITVVAVSQTWSNCMDPGYIEEASVRVRMQQTSGTMRATVARNPWVPGEVTCEFRCCVTGIDRLDEVFQVALHKGLIRKEGSWYYTGDQLLGQGEAVAQRALQSRRGLYMDLTAALLDVSPRINMRLDCC